MASKNFAKVYSAELVGIEAKFIEVEVDINVGLHAFGIFGLADRALNEAKERVNSALKNSGVKPPNRENRKITVNLAPADVKKTGSHYDLAIALGYLLATKQIRPFETFDRVFIGELALDGRLRPVAGTLNVAQMAAERGFRQLFVPRENAAEAAAMDGISVIPVNMLADAIAFLEGRAPAAAAIGVARHTGTSETAAADGVGDIPAPPSASDGDGTAFPDFSEIIGQENAKRALTIAAAGGHNILMVGPPGVGKSMLARALAGILPDLTRREAIEATKIWSAAGLSPGRLMRHRPFRAPHQTASAAALIGGGPDPKPGEVSLAHRGVLFLDELPEFPANALEALREPMESGVIRIARAKQTFAFPSRFALVAAMNPCPCGYYGDAERACTCTAYEVVKYQRKVSGPLLDRVDIQIKVGRIKIGELRKGEWREPASPRVRTQIAAARKRQAARFERIKHVPPGNAAEKGADAGASVAAGDRAAPRPLIATNAEMTSREAQAAARTEPQAEKFLETLDRSRISPRGYYRILKVARTIADLEAAERISAEHLAEAFSYRLRDGP